MAWPAAPLTRLSGAENPTARPGAPACTEIRQSFVPTTSDSRGGPPSITRTKGEPAEKARRAPASSPRGALVFTEVAERAPRLPARVPGQEVKAAAPPTRTSR